ncbi:MAG: glycosyltransferase [Nanoarchaeota archaeon]|nr:glycosyltransferase [Nanoarchaeota archaeon]
MKSKIIFSIIIPVKEINQHVLNHIPILLDLNYPKDKYEILVLPDEDNKKLRLMDVKIIPTGSAGPAKKRDLGTKHSKGKYLVFIDDDAYPKRDYLKVAEKLLENEKIISGPNLTPPESNIWQKASGGVFSNLFVSGPARARYRKTKKKYLDDAPSCNFIIDKNIFNTIGGFDSEYWPGEDSKLCNDLLEKGYTILYDPDLIVYHHRRPLFKEHLKQVWSYSVHRGYFAKKFPTNSRKIKYFLPSLLIFIGAILLLFSFFFTFLFHFLITLILIFSLITVLDSKDLKNIRVIILTIIGSFLTIIIYGIGILRGLLKKDLRSKYRK